jgi:hypothetical protein
MRSFAALAVVGLACQPAAAITCEQVRHYVDTYGASVVLAYAKKVGATPQQIREGRACLRRVVKREEARNDARESTVER